MLVKSIRSLTVTRISEVQDIESWPYVKINFGAMNTSRPVVGRLASVQQFYIYPKKS